ncbi:isoleucine--tRNA ligase [Rickettsiales bacterium LUAb2]
MSEKVNYKDTVRLPKTNFPMKANLKDLAIKVRENWDNLNIYSAIRLQSKGLPKFILHDGPPYANGNIHMGTSLNKVLKDFIIKGYQLMGYDAPYVPGWDCHGLPIEWKIEENYKKNNINKNDINVLEFRAECRKFADHWLNVQKQDFKDLGVIADFDNPYITMTNRAEALIYKEITKCLMQGNLYLGKKPVMWSVIEETALAEAEVEYYDKVSDAVFVGFKVAEFNKQLWQDALAVVWTTTPWTLPANEAITYNDKINYGLYEVISVSEGSLVKPKTKLIIAEDLASSVLNSLLVTANKLLDTNIGLNSLKVEHPLYKAGYNKVVNAYVGDFVETTVGSGIVHTAPAYGIDDFNIGKQHSLPSLDVLNDNGTYKDDVVLFAGQHIFKVNPMVIEKLQECNTLLRHDKLKHSYPHSWRSKAPLIYRLTSQWFLNLDHNKVREKAVSAIANDITFLPKSGENRLMSMVKNRPDWCLSRQRLWGVPMAMFKHKKTEELLKDDEVNQKIIDAFLEEGSDAWYKGDVYRFLTSKYNKDDYIAIHDVIDVWFDSGSTHAFVLRDRAELQAPADLYIEGSDQHRGWFQSSLIESILSYGKSPYKTLITHGFVLDQKGQKMSKSLGNIINPKEIIDKYGIEILRLWVVNSNYQDDVRIGDEILKQQVDVYRKIRNTIRYMLGNLSYFKQSHVVEYNDLPELEKWLLHKIYVVNTKFENCFKQNYEFHHLFNEIYNFITLDCSAFYFDICKDTMYCDAEDDIKFKSSLTVNNILFDYLIKWLTPFITYTAEEAYKERGGEKESIVFERLIAPKSNWFNEQLVNKWERIKQIRKVVLAAIEIERANKVIGSSLEAEPTIYLTDEDLTLLEDIDFATICIISGVKLDKFTNKPASSFIDNTVSNVAVVFNKKQGEKCERCWKIVEQTNNSLCARCESVLKKQ